MFKSITYNAILAVGLVFGGAVASRATARAGHGHDSPFGTAIRMPVTHHFGRPFERTWNSGFATRTLGRGAIYGGATFYEGADADDPLYESIDDRRHDEGNCRLERRAFEDLDLRRVRSVLVCD
jgi:hypothetical protein